MTHGQPPAQDIQDIHTAKAAEVRADIERTRQQLGETVEALAAKADMKAQARQKVSLAKQQAAARVAKARQLASARASQARSQATARASQLSGRAGKMRTALPGGGPARGQLTGGGEVAGAAGQAAPSPWRRGVQQAAGMARGNPASVGAAAASVVFLTIAVVAWRNRR